LKEYAERQARICVQFEYYNKLVLSSRKRLFSLFLNILTKKQEYTVSATTVVDETVRKDRSTDLQLSQRKYLCKSRQLLCFLIFNKCS